MRSARALVLALALVVALTMTGCAGAPSPAAKDAGGNREMASGMAPAAPVAAPQEAPAQPVLGESSYGGRTPADLPSYEEVGAERMIIRTANLSVVVKDTGETMEALTGLVAAYKGYVADSNRWYSNDQLYAAATLRVPADALDAFLAEVRDLAIKVESENISGNDVTEEYADINAQLVNLEATEVELRELLTEVRENRGKAEEIMSVYRELSSVRGQIESLKGRQKYLGQMVAMSTVNLQVRPELAPRAVVRESWNPVVTMSNAANTLVEVVKTFVSVIIYVVVLSPVVLVPLAILWLLAWYLRRRKKARKASEPEAQA